MGTPRDAPLARTSRSPHVGVVCIGRGVSPLAIWPCARLVAVTRHRPARPAPTTCHRACRAGAAYRARPARRLSTTECRRALTRAEGWGPVRTAGRGWPGCVTGVRGNPGPAAATRRAPLNGGRQRGSRTPRLGPCESPQDDHGRLSGGLPGCGAATGAHWACGCATLAAGAHPLPTGPNSEGRCRLWKEGEGRWGGRSSLRECGA